MPQFFNQFLVGRMLCQGPWCQAQLQGLGNMIKQAEGKSIIVCKPNIRIKREGRKEGGRDGEREGGTEGGKEREGIVG